MHLLACRRALSDYRKRYTKQGFTTAVFRVFLLPVLNFSRLGARPFYRSFVHLKTPAVPRPTFFIRREIRLEVSNTNRDLTERFLQGGLLHIDFQRDDIYLSAIGEPALPPKRKKQAHQTLRWSSNDHEKVYLLLYLVSGLLSRPITKIGCEMPKLVLYLSQCLFPDSQWRSFPLLFLCCISHSLSPSCSCFPNSFFGLARTSPLLIPGCTHTDKMQKNRKLTLTHNIKSKAR